MPIHYHLSCDRCEYEAPVDSEGYTYATDQEGRRVMCLHPGELRDIKQVTGMDWAVARAAGRVGHISYLVCRDCRTLNELDKERDAVRCAKCGSGRLGGRADLEDGPCIACHEGTLRKATYFKADLDPDRATLPVPEIVKEIVAFVQTGEVPASLKEAYERARLVDTSDPRADESLAAVCFGLMQWWWGTRGRKPCLPDDKHGPVNLKYPISEKWVVVVESTPALGALILRKKDYWWFKPEVSAEVRRGIVNYVRVHHFAPMMS